MGTAEPEHRWVLSLLGDFELTRLGESAQITPTDQRIVAYAVLQGGSVSRVRVAGTLWPDHGDAQAMASLRSSLSRLRRLNIPIQATHEVIRLSSNVSVDLFELREIAESRDFAVVMANSRARAVLFSGDLLRDWDEDWLVEDRERYRQLRLHLLERLCQEATDGGDFALAVELCQLAVAASPLRESAHQRLISVHIAEGNRAEAIHQFQAYARLMQDELGLDVAPEIARLMQWAYRRARSGKNVGLRP